MKFFLLILFSLTLSSCKGFISQPSYEYEDVISRLIKPEEVFIYKEGEFYFYNPFCHICESIKNDVINYSFYRPAFYFIEKDKTIILKSDGSTPLGVDSFSSFFIVGYPSLVIISDFKIISYFSGSTEINKYIGVKN